jgi:chromosome segregation ATPase
MNSNRGEAVDGATRSSSLDSTLQSSLVETLPDLLFLLADTREQLEQTRTHAASVEGEVDAANEAHARLLTLVAGLQDDLKRISQENTELADRVVSAGPYAHSLEVRISEVEAECRRQAEAARQAGLQVAVAEAQLREIRESRSWRIVEPFRRAGALVRRIRSGNAR